MGELAIFQEESNKKSSNTNTIKSVENTETEELVFAICSPIGSLKEKVLEKLKEILKVNYGYEVNIIKLSSFIDEFNFTDEDLSKLEKQSGSREFEDYHMKINKGNIIRKKYNNARLAEFSVKKIHLDRVKFAQDETKIKEPQAKDYTSRRVCYILDSIKTKEELFLLRKIYTDNFFSISIFSPLDDRKSNLKDKKFHNAEIEKIIEIDDKQKFDYGQNVRDAFVEGDLFIRVSRDNVSAIEKKIKRFIHLIFESSIVTPTIEEIAMYNAKAASGNSACLSRQVGACIIDDKGNILSIGWNDVPKFGGNLYSSNLEKDNRCYVSGECKNDIHKDYVVENIVDTIIKDELLKDSFKKCSGIEDILKKNIRNNTKVNDLIEFSRSVHAEMHAIIQGAQITGDRMVNGKLFCTTYPCHNCARHIIAAGIKEVYYIEPYVKSLCLSLHGDAVTENEEIKDKVRILIFDGVSPRKYLTFFTNFVERKEKGKLIKKDLKKMRPKICKSLQALSTLEEQAVHSLN